MIKQIIKRLLSINIWHLVLITVAAEIITAIMNTIMGIVWWGSISYDLIQIGIVDALVASLIIGSIILYVFQLLRESEEKLRQYKDDLEKLADKRTLELSGAVGNLQQEIAERRLAEKALKLSNEKLSKAFRSSPDWITISTLKDGRYIDVNDAFLRISGYNMEDVIGRTSLELGIWAFPEERRRMVEIVSDCGFVSNQEVRLRIKSGEVLTFTRSSEMIDIGEEKCIISVSHEITHRKMAEEELRRSHEFSRVILNSLNDAVSIVDVKDFSIVSVNRTFLDEVGMDKEDVIGRTCYAVTHHLPSPCSSEDHFCPLIETRTTGMHTVAEHQHFHKDGKRVYVEVSASPIRDKDGEIIQIVHASRNITERKLAEKAIRESEERFRQIFEQGEDALFLFQPDNCRIIDVNPAAVKLYGYTREELIGSDPSLFLAEDEYKRCSQTVCDVDTSKSVRIDQITNIKKDGTRIIVSVWGKIIRLREMDVLYCSFRDMTEKVRLNEESRLIQAKLIQANKMTSLGTLVSGVAHEINNPNNFILFNTQLLAEAWQDVMRVLSEYHQDNDDFLLAGLPFSEMREIVPRLLSGISDGSQRISNIVENLKDFSRQDRADMNGRVDINEVITTSTSILSNQIRKHTENFLLDFDTSLPPARGSAQQLEQVIINLIMNALQALPDKTRAVRISTARDRDTPGIIIRIKDEGIGMSANVMERIMEPFFTTRLDQGGTGLGLSISYSIVKDHKGSLKFESEEGSGTTASLILQAW
ncbi:MAG: PAS domain S-box protein [Nitrospirae bacterium]|nr:PAS domain S-box protein [Nitrospirota bacterium]